MGRRKLSTTVYLTPEQDEQLHALSKATRIPIAELIRQGIDLALVYEMAKEFPRGRERSLVDEFRAARAELTRRGVRVDSTLDSEDA